MAFDPKQIITDQIIDQMATGSPKWRKPWVSGLNRNPITGSVYKPINQLLLANAGFSDWRWYGPGYCVENGLDFKGAKKVYISTYFKPEAGTPIDTDGQSAPLVSSSKSASFIVLNPLPRMVLTGLFNAEQIRGIPTLKEVEVLPEFTAIEMIDKLIERLCDETGLKVEHGGQLACYAPSADTITMPHKSFFLSPLDYHACLLHEAGHAACNERRLNLSEKDRFGSMAYAYEEFVVELSSAHSVAAFHGALSPTSLGQHAAYMKNWISICKSDKEAVFRGSKDAAMVSDYLASFAPGATQELDIVGEPVAAVIATPAPAYRMKM